MNSHTHNHTAKKQRPTDTRIATGCPCENVKIYDGLWRCMKCFRRFVPLAENEMYTAIEIIDQRPVVENDAEITKEAA